MKRPQSGRQRDHDSHIDDNHIDDEGLRSLAVGDRRTQLSKHLRSCATCADAVALYRAIHQPTHDDTLASCPEEESLVRFAAAAALEGASPLRSHIDACADCTAEVQALMRVATDAGPLPLAPLRTRTPTLAARLRSLVQFEFPLPIVLHTRGPKAEGAEAMDDGIEAMQARRFDDARAAFRGARRAGDPAPAIDFYLGVLLLEQGRAAQAIRSLEKALQARHRSAETRYYLAQALLRKGDAKGAHEQLRAVARMRGPHRAAARQLAAQVEEMISSSS